MTNARHTYSQFIIFDDIMLIPPPRAHTHANRFCGRVSNTSCTRKRNCTSMSTHTHTRWMGEDGKCVCVTLFASCAWWLYTCDSARVLHISQSFHRIEWKTTEKRPKTKQKKPTSMAVLSICREFFILLSFLSLLPAVTKRLQFLCYLLSLVIMTICHQSNTLRS